MIRFREFITENLGIPVISISKEQIDLSKEETRQEINEILAMVLEEDVQNPYVGWLKVTKILALYNIILPRVLFHDPDSDEEIVIIDQFGGWGAELNGDVTSPNDLDNSDYYLYYSYNRSDVGLIEAYAQVADNNEIDDLMQDDDTEIDDQEGQLDPRQEE